MKNWPRQAHSASSDFPSTPLDETHWKFYRHNVLIIGSHIFSVRKGLVTLSKAVFPT